MLEKITLLQNHQNVWTRSFRFQKLDTFQNYRRLGRRLIFENPKGHLSKCPSMAFFAPQKGFWRNFSCCGFSVDKTQKWDTFDLKLGHFSNFSALISYLLIDFGQIPHWSVLPPFSPDTYKFTYLHSCILLYKHIYKRIFSRY